jgi:hypothetical protein
VKVMFVNKVAPTQERSVDLQMALPCLVAVPDAAESLKSDRGKHLPFL